MLFYTIYLDKHINKHGTTEKIKIVEQNVSKLKNHVINFLDTEKLERGQVLYEHDQIINLSSIVSVKAMMFKEIANKLGIAENTVKNHLKSVFNKAGVKTRVELINIFTK